jgi:hypothetical protein
MTELKNIQASLNLGLNASGVSAVKPLADTANQQAPTVKASLDQLAAQFKELGVALAPSS